MIKNSTKFIYAVLLSLFMTAASAQPVGQLQSGQVWGNFGATQGLAAPTYMMTFPVVGGNIVCFNGTTGRLTDCGISPTSLNLIVGTTTLSSGTSPNTLFNNGGVLGEIPAAETVTTYGTTTTFNFSTFKNTAVTLTGNITTQTLTNVPVGRAGMITFIQDGGGGHTTVWNSIFKFTGGTTPTLTATGGAIDVLTYSCRSASFCAASLLPDVR